VGGCQNHLRKRVACMPNKRQKAESGEQRRTPCSSAFCFLLSAFYFLRGSEALAIFAGDEKRLDHFGFAEVAVEFV
jgi:hypothetical protein